VWASYLTSTAHHVAERDARNRNQPGCGESA
jgi:hypothetical protein